MTKTWPPAVDRLIEAFGSWRTERLGQWPSERAISDELGELPMILLMESPPPHGYNTDPHFAGFESVTDFLANARPDEEFFPYLVMCLTTVGDSHRPYLFPFEIRTKHAFDVLATAETLLAYYEAKERLPKGLAWEAASWLMGETHRVGYGDGGLEQRRDKKGREALEIFRNAITSLTDVNIDSAVVMKIFDEKNFSYSSQLTYTVGKATRIFCRSFCLPSSQYYNEALARIFEWKARDLLADIFVSEVGYRYKIAPKTKYLDLPKSTMAGAFIHLPVPSALPNHEGALPE